MCKKFRSGVQRRSKASPNFEEAFKCILITICYSCVIKEIRQRGLKDAQLEEEEGPKLLLVLPVSTTPTACQADSKHLSTAHRICPLVSMIMTITITI